MLALSLGPGIGYVLLGVIYDAVIPTASWYSGLLLLAAFGYRLHRQFDFDRMTQESIAQWYQQTRFFYYLIFGMWTVIFILIVPRTENNLHYIAIFTQIGASVVSSTLLFSDRKLFIPTIAILMGPLLLYFTQLGEWYGYILTIFSMILWWVLYYASNSSHELLQQSYRQSSRDQLTGMYNRAYFMDSMEQTINTLKQTHGYSCLILIDLDYFKTINDSLGHDIGDLLLREVAERMNALVPQNAIAARMGGDEFILVTPISTGRESCVNSAKKLAQQIRQSLKQTYEIDRHHLYISASVGISIIHEPSGGAIQYIKEADIAMYEVKDKGRDDVVVFTEDVSIRVEKDLEIERRLHFALQNNEISLAYQPQVNQAQKIVGCEVLARWNNEVLGEVSPSVFVPIAEKTGLIIEIGNFILAQAFKTLHEWIEQGIRLEQFSINVSMRQFFFQSFLENLQSLCEQYLCQDDKSLIVLEMTESTMAEEIDRLVEMMNQMKAGGLSFSIDDFGTGYSSLSYLRQVPLDEIKIDRSFTSQITSSEESQAMIKTIIHLAKQFNLKVVAEGVENQEQMNFLLENDCDLLQGYLFSKPLARDEFELRYTQNHA